MSLHISEGYSTQNDLLAMEIFLFDYGQQAYNERVFRLHELVVLTSVQFG